MILASQLLIYIGSRWIEWLAFEKARNHNTQLKFPMLPADWKVQKPAIPRFGHLPVLIIGIIREVINLLK